MSFTYVNVADTVLEQTSVVQGTITLNKVQNTSVNTNHVMIKVYSYNSTAVKYWFYCNANLKANKYITSERLNVTTVRIVSSSRNVSWQTFVTEELNELPSSQTKYSIEVYLSDGTTMLGARHEFTIKFDPEGNFRPVINVTKLTKSDTSDYGYVGTGMTAGTACTKFLQGYSRIRCTVPSITTKMGATITGYNITIADVNDVDFTGSSMTFLLDYYPNVYGKKKLTFTVTDSRGLSSSITETIEILPYHPPILYKNTSARENGVGTTFYMNFVVDWAKTGLTDTQLLDISANSDTVSMPEFVLESDIAPYTVTDEAFAGTIPATSTVAITITMTDQITTSTYVISVPVSSPVMSIRAAKVGINNGDPQGALDVVGNVLMNGVGILGGYRGYISSELSGAVSSTCSVTDSGLYYVIFDGTSSEMNTPTSSGGLLLVFYINDSVIGEKGMRIYYSESNETYLSKRNGSSWSSWVIA